MKKPFKITLSFILALSLTSFVLVGCGEKEAEPSAKTAQESDRLSKIRTETGGDWSKVSEADKEWLIKDVCFGNEGSAKMLISPPPKPPGGPNGGPPKRP